VYFISTSRKGGSGVLGQQTTKGVEKKGETPAEHPRPYLLFVSAPSDILKQPAAILVSNAQLLGLSEAGDIREEVSALSRGIYF
jgi:hypothetical protein